MTDASLPHRFASIRSRVDAPPDRTNTMTRSRTEPKLADDICCRRHSIREVSRAISLSIRRAGSLRSNRSQQAPLQCSLEELTETYIARCPKFYSTPYDAAMPHSASGAIALVHNAAQKELVALVSHIIPACLRAARGDVTEANRRSEAMRALSRWWDGFFEFSVFVAKIENLVVERMFRKFSRDEQLMFEHKERHAAERQRKKILERTSLTTEIVFRAVLDTIAEGVSVATPERFIRVVQTLNIVVNFLLETYDLVNSFVRVAETRLRKSKVFGIVNQVVRTIGKCENFPMLTVILVRWMDNPDAIHNWARKYLGRRARKSLCSWEQAYASDRGVALDTIVNMTT